ncbi:unnamed protein product [Plutella xylostella]|uniref:(diamondback moth) hypothetical protein n=1 Tax=Plutella xylostella TaxID=51655 RepID=A0A8S4G7F6_PLUXY|nr:unnamed protein product [Plutella xylostella]
MIRPFNVLLFGGLLLSLFEIDTFLGQGLGESIKKAFCTVFCTVKKAIQNSATSEIVQKLPSVEIPIDVSLFTIELCALFLSMMFISKYRQLRSKDRIDELLQESKDALQQTNAFLQKWQNRRNMVPECPYLYEDLNAVSPTFEVPILQMAIIDSKSNQLERGDAGDNITVTNTTLQSILDDDIDSIDNGNSEDLRNVDPTYRYLWDVVEEDADRIDDL